MRKVANGVALWLSVCFSRAKPTMLYASHIAVFGLPPWYMKLMAERQSLMWMSTTILGYYSRISYMLNSLEDEAHRPPSGEDDSL